MTTRIRQVCLFLLLGALALALPATAAAQQFGKNPLRTNPEFGNLSMVSSGRVDIVYYAPLDTLARLALPIADSCITAMEEHYQHQLAPWERVTIFLFGENEDYRQGWVLPGYVTPPSIGYTEPLKGNIGVSFDGDAPRLHELACHEIAHRFQLSIHDESYADHPGDDLRQRQGEYRFPPWVTEGDATWVSDGFNSLQEMIVRYVVNGDRVDFSLQDMLSQPRSILSYYLGSEFWRFASGEYENDLLAALHERERGIFSRLRLSDTLRVRFLKDQALYKAPAAALEDIYGVTMPELDRAFDLYLHLRYGRDYNQTLDPVMFADRVLPGLDEWSEQPDLVGPRVVQITPERADTVVDLFYTANPDGYPGIFTLTLPFSHESLRRTRETPDPALFDACLRRDAADCEEYLVVLAGDGADGAEAGDAAEESKQADEADEPDEELTDEEKDRRKAEERRLKEERKEEERQLEEAEKERERLLKAARRAITPRPHRIVRSGTESCQSLDPRTNRLEGFSDGKRRLLAYVCTDSRTQVRLIAVRDLATDREIERFPMEGIANLSSPTWSPDGSQLAVAGISRSGTWDLYTIRRAGGEITRLTSDVYADGAPDWSPDGRTIAFTSDRSPFGVPVGGQTSSNIFLLDLASGDITYLTYGRWKDLAPRWSPDGSRVLFSSDRGGAFDLYVVDVSGEAPGMPEQVTQISTGILSAEWWPDGSSIVFTAFDGQAQIFRMDLDAGMPPEPRDDDAARDRAPRVVTAELPAAELPAAERADADGEAATVASAGAEPARANAPDSSNGPGPGDRWTPSWSWAEQLEDPLVRMAQARPLPDRFHLTLGGVGGVVGTNVGLASLSLLYTTLDNSRILFSQFSSAAYTGDTRFRAGFGKYQNIYGAVGYLNLSGRTFWGAHCYRQSGLFIDDVRSNIFGEDHLGCRATAQHPLSLFRRFEFQAGAEWSDQADLREVDFLTFTRLRDHKDDISFTRRAALLQAGVAYVQDNTLWVDGRYPVDGSRYRVDCHADFDIGRFRPDTYTCYADGRKYFRLGERSNAGLRAYGFHSDGVTSRRFTLDWRNHMTLYPAFGLYGQRGWIGNAFLAFPLIERLSIRTPPWNINFPPIRGAFFADAGQAWLDGEEVGPVWADAGISATMPLGPVSLGVAWGGRFTLGGSAIELPERLRGTTWRLLLVGTP